MRKKKILILIDWFTPAYKAGGPIRSVSNLVEALKDFYDLEILTSAYDLDGSLLDVEVDKWIPKNGFKIFYKTKSKQCFSFCKQIFTSKKYDAIYMNSMYSREFTLVPLLIMKLYGISTSIVLSPRGMLGRGARRIKFLKKRIFLFFSRILGLYRGIIWHAASSVEERDIRRVFNKAKIFTVANLPLKPDKFRSKRLTDTLNFVFYSRILPIKNLDFALNILKKVKVEKKIKFTVLGTIEDKDYWATCLKLADQLPSNIIFEYAGEVSSERIADKLSNFDFLFLPTRHENFGHTIFEALASSLPIIISDRTPWRDLQTKGIGWDIDLTQEHEYIKTIESIAYISSEEYQKMRKKSFEFAVDFYQKIDIERYKQIL